MDRAIVSNGRSPDVTADRLQDARRYADIAHGRLVEAGRTVAVAESLTGGLISVFLTEAPGTSVTFRGGLVVYGTDVKHTIAGVSEDDLAEHGAVHPVVAEQLASGVRDRLGADYGIGATGVAGPGDQDGRPVGEVFIAIASEAGVTAKKYEFAGSREQIRLAAAAAALSDLIGTLQAAAGTEELT